MNQIAFGKKKWKKSVYECMREQKDTHTHFFSLISFFLFKNIHIFSLSLSLSLSRGFERGLVSHNPGKMSPAPPCLLTPCHPTRRSLPKCLCPCPLIPRLSGTGHQGGALPPNNPTSAGQRLCCVFNDRLLFPPHNQLCVLFTCPSLL